MSEPNCLTAVLQVPYLREINLLIIIIITIISLFIHDNNRPLLGFEPQTGH